MNDIVKNVRKENIKAFLSTLFWGLGFTGMGIMFLIGVIIEEISLLGIIACLFMIPFGIFIDCKAIEYLKIVINPLSGPVFKKYGDESKIQEILNDINNNIEYQDRRIILSKQYIMEKNNIESIVPYENVLGVYKSVHKTNFVVDYYKIVITDKFNDSVYITYPRDEEEIMDKVISILALRCKNAKFGYSNETFKHINENKQDLKTYTSEKNDQSIRNNEKNLKEDNTENKEMNKEKKYCTKCGKLIEEEWTFCNYCGNKL